MAGFALKLCPFCGAPAEIFRGQQMRDGHMTHYVLARCTNCKAGTRRTEYQATEPFSEPEEQKAVNLWNRRYTNGRD